MTTVNSETVILTYGELTEAVENWLRVNRVLDAQESVIFIDLPVSLNPEGDVEIEMESIYLAS